MSLSIGIVGLPNVGKSTLFNALTKKSVPAENFPFCTIDPSVGVVAVPDGRLEALARLSQSEKTIPAVAQFVDIAGLVKGASEGEGLGNQFLSHIREVDAIAEVVRVFEDEDVTHVHGSINPLHDIEVINLELMMADLSTVSARLAKLEREVKKGDKEARAEHEICAKISRALEAGMLARELSFTKEELATVRGLHLISMKPILYVLNRKSGTINVGDEPSDRLTTLMQFFESKGALHVSVDAGVEQELSSVGEDERDSFRREFGALDDGVNTLIRKGYELLDLISFFTTGKEETRAWTIKRGAAAPEAGAAIHSDFKDKFIRAEVIPAEKLLDAGSYAVAREKGLVATVGKEYVVSDGDVMHFKI